MPPHKPPFPYFGGKRRAAHLVWERFGPVATYVEPFFGSGAVLLGCPHGARNQEVINDLNGYVCNFWRAIAAEPDTVAHYADWPVVHSDLGARKNWLLELENSLTEKQWEDPDYYDPKAAGYWCWMVSNSIDMGRDRTIGRIPHVGSMQGCQAAQPDHSGGDYDPLTGGRLKPWFRGLAERLSRTIVLCKDWGGIVSSPTVMGLTNSDHGDAAVFLDPPYSTPGRHQSYLVDSMDAANEVHKWAVSASIGELGPRYAKLKICVAGYIGDYDGWPEGWETVTWNRGGGMESTGNGPERRRTEALYFSPSCGKSIQGFLL